MTAVPRGTGADVGVHVAGDDLSVACQLEFTFVLLAQDPLFDQVFDDIQTVVVGMYLVFSEISLSWVVCAHTSDFPSDLGFLSVLTCGSIFKQQLILVTFRYAEYENFPCTLGQKVCYLNDIVRYFEGELEDGWKPSHRLLPPTKNMMSLNLSFVGRKS